MRSFLISGVAAVLLLPAQIPPELEQLGRVNRRMRQHLNRTVSHTCLETIERSRINRAGREQRHDTVRLEVAFVGDRELFSWPGASRFDDREVGDLVNGGAIGSGVFASIARAVFLGGWATFKFVDKETVAGMETLRWDFEVPLAGSGWTIRMGAHEGRSAFSGSFWADPATGDVVRLKSYAVGIPPHVPIAEVIETIDYALVRIGEEDLLLPQRAEMLLVDFTGEKSRNRAEFSHCRQYLGEAKLSFDDPVDTATTAPKVTRPLNLPAGLMVRIRLDTEIDSTKAAVGDPLRATIEREVLLKGQRLAPAGAAISGRVRWLSHYGANQPYWVIGIELNEVTAEDVRGPFYARIDTLDASPSILGILPDGTRGQLGERPPLDLRRMITVDQLPLPRKLPGVALLYVRGAQFRIPKGLKMTWKTEKP